MTNNSSTHNKLFSRVISQITPPNSHRRLRISLLALPIAVVALVAALALSSCSKESFGSQIEDMEYFYNESCSLTRVAGDSIQRFATKVETYVVHYPEEKYNPYYPEIVDNIQSAAKLCNITIVISIDPEWEGEIVVNY